MLSKCLNPGCSATFQYLGQGRLFRFDFAEAGRRRAPSGKKEKVVAAVPGKAHPMEHFWLCESCAAAMTIEFSDAGEVYLVRIESCAKKPAAASAPREQTAREAIAS
jgi:hypothetical protein